jgi:SagB-type dehydrogenase family enzyme
MTSHAPTDLEASSTVRPIVERLSLRRDANLSLGEDGQFVLARSGDALVFSDLSAELADTVRRLSEGDGVRMQGHGSTNGGAGSEPQRSLLAALQANAWITSTLYEGGTPLAALEPTGTTLRVCGEGSAARSIPRLSRFCVMHTSDGQAVLESPRTATRMILHDPSLGALLVALAQGNGPASVDANAHRSKAVIELLERGGLLADADEHTSQRLVQWNLHDMLFHQHSRVGRSLRPFGGTYHLRPRFELPRRRVPRGTGRIGLERPALETLARSDPPLQAVIEQRRSIRQHDDENPISRQQLSEFLYRTTSDRPADYLPGPRRPYPGGGAMYELQVYPMVRLCDGVDAGLYWYDSTEHALALVCADRSLTGRLLQSARRSTDQPAEPQVLLIIAARVGRMMWKYERMPYAAVLKHVGVLIHQFYLVATALGLAPCGIGGGDSEAFAVASGVDPYEEPNVGEFMLGSRPAETTELKVV